MTPSQIERLQRIYGKLVERALIDANPSGWVAGNKKPKTMTAAERGNAAWCRKIASQTLTVMFQVQRIVRAQTAPPVPEAAASADDPAQVEEPSVDAEIARYEKAAKRVIERAGAPLPKP